MSTIRLLSEELQLSSFTVSAALRGRPGVSSGTRERVLQHARKAGYLGRSAPSPFRGSIAILRVVSLDGRGQASFARHRAICRGAREGAAKLGYGAEEVTLEVTDLKGFAALVTNRDFRGLLVLPGPDARVLVRICLPRFPCVYADAPFGDLAVDSVCPDYQQAISLAFQKLHSLGYKKPGLMLDRDMPWPAMERLISVYRTCFAACSASTPAPLVTPARTIDGFASWVKGRAFDALLATDVEHAKRLLFADSSLPVFGLNADAACCEQGINLDLVSVGRRAVETLLDRTLETKQSAKPLRLSVPVSWMDSRTRGGARGCNTK